MTEPCVIYSCGELIVADGQSVQRVDDAVALDLDDHEGQQVAIADQIEAELCTVVAREAPLRVQFERDRGSRKLQLLPPWKTLIERQLAQIEAAGVSAGTVVTPRAWTTLASDRGRDLLYAMAALGWRWQPLEDLLVDFFHPATRAVSAAGIHLRIFERERSLVVANGSEAGRALEFVDQILKATLAELEAGMAKLWLKEEFPTTGWFTRLQIAEKVGRALTEGRRNLVLGGRETTLFRFSDLQSSLRFYDLGALRSTIELPKPSAAIWWDLLAEAPASAGPEARPGIDWGARETVLLTASPESGLAPSLRSLQTYLRFNGRPLRLAPVTSLVGLVRGQNLLEVLDAQTKPANPALASGQAAVPPSLFNPTLTTPQASEVLAKIRAAAAASNTEQAIAVRPSRPLTAASAPASDPAPPAPVPARAPTPGLTSAPVPPPSLAPAATPASFDSWSSSDDGATPSASPGASEGGDFGRAEVAPEPAEVALDPLLELFEEGAECFSLDEPHDPSQIRVYLGGERVPPENVLPVRRGDRSLYKIQGMPVPHGAILRIDFDALPIPMGSESDR